MKSHQLGNPVLFAITIACTAMTAVPATAQISVGVGISLPTPIVFVAPPQVVVLPGFDIYVAPDIAEEIYFVDGFWWRPWQGHWYRSQSYDSGWSRYSDVPYFYRNVRQGWRDDYRNHRWEGQNWNYERMPHQRVEQNWSSWKQSNYWQEQQNWGVPEMKARRQDSGERSSAPASQQRAPEQAPRVQSSPDPKHSPQPKAAQQLQRSAPPRATQQQRSAQPKVAAPSQHRSSQPKTASSKRGGAPAEAQKQRSPQSKGSAKAKSDGHGQGDKGQPAGQHGGGKDKK